jgi:uncharacterized iron-regulated protein
MIKVIPGITLFVGMGIGFADAALITACANQAPVKSPVSAVNTLLPWKTQQRNVESIVDPNDGESFAELLSELEEKRAVFVGETHDRDDHHLNQLAIIRGLHERGVDLAVGMEFFQAPFQPVLDQYVAGEIEEKEFLRKTEYYERWKYDYRLYRDILVYARNNGISLVALNAPSELVARVSKGGIAGLTAEERALLPIDLPSPGSTYIDRLRPVFEMHGKMPEERFRRFVEVQLLWDEHMASVAGDYLRSNSEKTLVILAGSGHVAFPDAIPGRLVRLENPRQAVVVTGSDTNNASVVADFVLAERDIELGLPGRLGMMLASEDAGVKIREVRPASPTDKAGFLPGHRIHRIAGEAVRNMQDVQLALLDRMPGEEVWVEFGPGVKPRNGETQARALPLL